MTTLDDISLAFDDIIDTPAKRKRQVAAADQEMRQRYAQSRNPFALLGAGIAGGIQGNTENLRRALVGMGGTGFKTQGENIAEQLRGIDTNNVAGQNQVLAIVGQADPGRALALKEFFNQKNAQMGATNAKAAEAESLRNSVSALVSANPQSQYRNLVTGENYANLGEDQLQTMFNRETDDLGLITLHYPSDNGSQAIYRDKDGNYYDMDMSRVAMDQVPENLMTASLVASNMDEAGWGSQSWERDLTEETVQIQALFRTTDRLMAALEDNPNLLTNTADFAAWANSQRVELDALRETMYGQASRNDKFDPDSAEIDSAFNEFFDLGADAVMAKPLILTLAYTQAASEQSAQSISDSDIVRYLDRLGANQSDGKLMRNIIKRQAEDAWLGYKTRFGMYHDDAEPPSDYGLTDILLPEETRKLRRQTLQDFQNF